MPGIAVRILDFAGGAQLSGHALWFEIDHLAVVCVGDPVEPHGDPPHSPRPVMVTGVNWFTIDGIPVCREGNLASCGHATSGRPWFDIEG